MLYEKLKEENVNPENKDLNNAVLKLYLSKKNINEYVWFNYFSPQSEEWFIHY